MNAAIASTLHALNAELGRAVVPHSQFAIFGSAVLYLHGLRDEIGDVDIAVTPEAFGQLLACGWQPTLGEHPDHPAFLAWRTDGHDVHAFEAWRADQPEISPALVIERAEWASGWPAAPLTLVAHHKATALVRSRNLGFVPPDKHVDDLARIVARIADVDSIT